MTQAYVENILIPFNGHYIKTAIHVWDPDNMRATALCVHRFDGDAAEFSLLASYLMEDGIRTVAMSFPGRGDSAFIAESGIYGPHLYQTCLSYIRPYLAKKVIGVGVSWGAAVLLLYLFASRLPVQGIALLDPVVTFNNEVGGTIDRLRREAAMRFSAPWQVQSYLESSLVHLSHYPPDLQTQILKAKIRQVGNEFGFGWDPAILGEIPEDLDFDMMPLMSRIIAPTLIIDATNQSMLKDQLPHNINYVASPDQRTASGLAALMSEAELRMLHLFILGAL